MTDNPFFYGNPVLPVDLLDREDAIDFIVGRILNRGQSSAIVGDPRLGKSSLLHYLSAQEMRDKLYGDKASRLLFHEIDSHLLGSQFTAGQFWQQALTPVKQHLVETAPASPLAMQYAVCSNNDFGNLVLENLFKLLKQVDRCLVLLIDEFDVLLYHPVLNSAEFFGGLRSLTSRSEGALAVVIASRQSTAVLDQQTASINPGGSPYFNTIGVMTLGALRYQHMATLLARAGKRFTSEDRRAVVTLAGGHPYLAQAIASALWDASEKGLKTPEERRRFVAQRVRKNLQPHFAETWQLWPAEMRKAFTSVGLAHAERLLPGRQFLTDAFIKGLRDWGPELSDLESVGAVVQNDKMKGGWAISAEAMLWWLTDELVRAIRTDTPFETWLRDQHLIGPLTEKEWNALGAVLHSALQILQQGAATLVETFAKGLGEGAASGIG